MICKKAHRYLDKLADLPESQKPDEGRHKCAGCAYEQGLEDGRNGNTKHLSYNVLPESQAGTGRHKSVQAAYDLGYAEGSA